MNTETYEDDVTLLTREDLEDRVVFLENKNRKLETYALKLEKALDSLEEERRKNREL